MINDAEWKTLCVLADQGNLGASIPALAVALGWDRAHTEDQLRVLDQMGYAGRSRNTIFDPRHGYWPTWRITPDGNRCIERATNKPAPRARDRRRGDR